MHVSRHHPRTDHPHDQSRRRRDPLTAAAGLLGLFLCAPAAHGGQEGTQAAPPVPAPPQAAAQATYPVDTSPAQQLTLDEALKLARKNNRDLQAARVRLTGSKTDVTRAWAAIYPRLTFQGKYTFNDPAVTVDFSAFAPLLPPALKGSFPSGAAAIIPENQLDANILATLPIIAPPAYAALRSAKQTYLSQQKQLDVTQTQLLQSVASAFYVAAGNDELVAARRHAIDVARQTLDNARARLEAGVVNRVEVTRAELALVQAQQHLLEAEDSRRSSYLVLDTLIQLRKPFKVVPPGEPQLDGRSDGELVMDALRQRPEVPALQAQVLAARYSADAAGLRWLPTISAFGSLRFTNANGFASNPDGSPRYSFYAAGLQLDWTLFDGFERDAARHAANAQAGDAQLRLSQLRDTIADDILTAKRGVYTKREGLRTSQRSLQLAQETLDLVRIQHDAGTATQLDLLTAQDQLVQAEVGLAQARFDLSLSDISLRRTVGSFPGL